MIANPVEINTPGMDYIGQPVLRAEDTRLLTGTGTFVDDIQLPDMVHLCVVRSPIAHARISSYDLEAARQAPGVLGVWSFDDIREDCKVPIPVPPGVRLPGFENYLQWPLAKGVVRYVGEPVAVVVATDRYLAEDAAELVIVDYDPLEVVTDVTQSARDEVLLHPDAGTNSATRYSVSRGDPDAAFRAPHYKRKETFNVHRHTGMPLETRGLVADWQADRGHLVIYGATKYPVRTRDALATMLGMPRTAVDYIELDVGGSFGVRGHVYPEDFLVAHCAKTLRRPVKFIEDRREHMMATHHSREARCELEIAVGADGMIEGLRARVFTDLGAYVACGGAAVVASKTVQFIPGPYRIANYGCELQVLVTNKTPIGTFRGPGRYESVFSMERLLDIVANDLQLDPVDFRKRNLLRNDELPYNSGLLVPSMGESWYDTGDYLMTLDRALKEIDYDRLKAAAGQYVEGRLHGVGVACYVDSTGVGPSETARIAVRSSKAIDVYVGSSSAGQGIETVMAQVAAERLGVDIQSVRVLHGSSTYTDDGVGFSHSRCAVMGGSAVYQAAGELIDLILDAAARKLALPRECLAYRSGVVYDERDGELLLNLDDLVADTAARPDGASGLDVTSVFRNTKLTYTYGAQVAHVAVDPRTAQVEVLRFLTVEDIGRAINPMIVHGQAIGASFQGISATFLDQFVYDESGQLMTGSFADYLTGTATDFPNVEAITLEVHRSPSNPLGVKGAGEGPISATGAVLANAVANALRPLKVEINSLPLSPNNLAGWIRAARRQEGQAGAPQGQGAQR
jgi:carbon-monoxide dehydrogenase large subunit